MPLILYIIIYKIDIFWNTLSPIITTNTDLAINTLTTNKVYRFKKVTLKNDPVKIINLYGEAYWEDERGLRPITGALRVSWDPKPSAGARMSSPP